MKMYSWEIPFPLLLASLWIIQKKEMWQRLWARDSCWPDVPKCSKFYLGCLKYTIVAEFQSPGVNLKGDRKLERKWKHLCHWSNWCQTWPARCPTDRRTERKLTHMEDICLRGPQCLPLKIHLAAPWAHFSPCATSNTTLCESVPSHFWVPGITLLCHTLL